MKSFVKSVYRPFRRFVNERRFPYRSYMNKNRCIFIHVPKTAGTSILLALGDNGKSRLHLPWHVFLSANQKKFDDYFKFSFVRNPWDRAWSAYNYLRNGGNKASDVEVSKKISEFTNFDQFLKKGLGYGYFRNHILFLPQSQFLIGPAGLPVVDFLGTVENFSQDFSVCLKEIGIKENVAISKHNVSPPSSPPSISGQGISVIEEIYRQDIEAFGYSFSDSLVKRLE